MNQDSGRGPEPSDDTVSAAPGARPASRRAVLRSAGALAVGAGTVVFLGACGTSGDSGGSGPANPLTTPSDQVRKAITAAVAGDQVEVGKAAFLDDVGIVLTRPSATTYQAFSDACTHQGGKVDRMNERGRLVCPLHGSEFDPATGQAVVGPASRPLPGAAVNAQGAVGS